MTAATRIRPNVKAICWDLYETLVAADYAAIDEGRRAIGRRLGIRSSGLLDAFEATLPDRQLGRFGGGERDFNAVLRVLGVGTGHTEAAWAVKEELSLWLRNVSPYDDALRSLTRLRKCGFKMALISNCTFQTRHLVDALGLTDSLDAVILSCEVGSLKPESEIFSSALEALDCAPSSGLLVDDNPAFLHGGEAVGMVTLAMARPGHRPSKQHGYSTVTSVANVADLLDC